MNHKITRKIDKAGRFVLPRDVRKALDLNDGDEIELSINGSAITVTKAKKDNYYNLLSEEGKELLKNPSARTRLFEIAKTVGATPEEYLFRFEKMLKTNPDKIFRALKCE